MFRLGCSALRILQGSKGGGLQHCGGQSFRRPCRGIVWQQRLIQNLFRPVGRLVLVLLPIQQSVGQRQLPARSILHHRHHPVRTGRGNGHPFCNLYNLILTLRLQGRCADQRVRRVHLPLPQDGGAELSPGPEGAVRRHRQAGREPVHLLQELLRLPQEIPRFGCHTRHPPEAAVLPLHQEIRPVPKAAPTPHIRHMFHERPC